jgi:hypothetical protein
VITVGNFTGQTAGPACAREHPGDRQLDLWGRDPAARTPAAMAFIDPASGQDVERRKIARNRVFGPGL